MAILRNRLGVAGILFLVTMAGWTAAQPDKPAADKDKAAPNGLDSLKNLPPGAIIVVCDDLKTAKQLSPNLILLTPKQYQEMRDEIARKNQPQPEPAAPGECHLTGAVEGDVVHLQAEFKFRTTEDREKVLLACLGGQPTSLNLDDKLPLVQATERGLVVQVEKPGDHVAQLSLDANIAPKGDRDRERGFELDLPGAAVTSLKLDLPEDVKEVLLGVSGPGRNWSGSRPTRGEGNHRRFEQRSLGAVTRLEMSWKVPAPAAAGPALLTAQGKITVRVTEKQVATEAELTLKPRGQPVAVWRLHVPANAQIVFKQPSDEDRSAGEIETPGGPDSTLRILRLKEPTLDSLQIVIQVEQKRGQGPVPIGPFAVEGAVRQRGDLVITAPSEARLRVVARAALSPREVASDKQPRESKVAFVYWLNSPELGAQPPPLVEVDLDASRGTIETRVEHTLQRTENAWRLKSVFQVTPPAAGVDMLTVQLPAEFRLSHGKPHLDEPAYSVSVSGNPALAEIKLAERQTRPFQVTLEGEYPITLESASSTPQQTHKVSLGLPLPQQATGRGTHKLVIQALENMDLQLPSERDPAWEVERTRTRQTWTSDRLPDHIDIEWKAHRQQLLLASVVDVTLNGRVAHVVQQIWFAASQAPTEAHLRKPDGIFDLAVLERGALDEESGTVVLAREATEKRPLRLQYSFSIRPNQLGADNAMAFAVPLLVPAPGSRCEITVRVACESATLVERISGPWEEQWPEALATRQQLAALVLRGDRPESPPVLRLREAAALATFGIERALIRARIGEQGRQLYHASFLLHPAGARFVDIELPAPPVNLKLEVSLAGLQASWGSVDETAPLPSSADPARVAHVPLGPYSPGKPTVLDIWYQINPAQLAGAAAVWTRALGPLQTVLCPPRLCGQAVPGSVRWQVELPPDWVPISADGALPADLTWAWRGWLIGTRPAASSADLERWFAEGGNVAAADPTESIQASVVSWRTDLGPLAIRHAPQQGWLLSCSVGLLAVAFGLYLLRGRRVLFWVLIVIVLAGAILAALSGGLLTAVLYGCEPGLVALLIVAAVQWLLHHRYRRQVVFLPSFKRVKAGGSSLIHTGGNARPREPSTVDAAPPVPSNQWATGGPSPSASGRAQPAGSSHTKQPPT
jgi:hypothetical protein